MKDENYVLERSCGALQQIIVIVEGGLRQTASIALGISFPAAVSGRISRDLMRNSFAVEAFVCKA